MTEETKKDSSNLCTTLDDFENFQSVSMYEEDEFITLSDIVSPRAEPSQQPSDMSEIPYDNEVVLSTNMDDRDEVNNLSETGMENNIPVEAPPVIATETSDAQQPSEDVMNVNTPTLPKQRGRKKKTLPTDESFQSPNKSEDDVLKPVRATRTRKPKVIYNEDGMFAEKTPKTTETNDIKNQISSAESNYSAKQRKGRRGRPKKVVRNESLPLGGETNGQHVKKTPGKRGRPKKSLLTDFDLNETPQPPVESVQPTELVSPIEIGTTLNESDILEPKVLESLPEQHASEACATEDHVSDNLPLKKKGRKHVVSKKAPLEPLVTDNDHQIVNKTEQQGNLNDCDEDGDDISLSQLKQKCDTNASNVEPDLIVDDIEDLGFEPLILEQKPTDIVPNTTETVINDEPTVVPNTTETVINDEPTVVPNTTETVINDEPTVEQLNNHDITNNSLLVEDTSKRPVRRKAKQTLHYDEGSDEDPYANMESESDDEPIGKRKSKRYNSDDEYVPGSKRGKLSSSDPSDSDIDDIELEELTSNKRKRSRKVSDLRSPNKKGKPDEPFKDINITTIVPTSNVLEDDDVEVCLQSSVIKASDDSKKNVWGMSNEFESFLAKKIHSTDLKIKKVSKEQPKSTPIEIPVLSTEAKKRVEMSCQTTKTLTKTVSVQTATNEVPMKDNVLLTPEQSEKACEFLKSIVKTTSELGQLMTQKSDDFITKKINTEHVTNTFKMDYCVKKSFLLLKLAKHNLIQMEDDLSKQYEEFLKTNGLSSCREEIKVIAPAPKQADSDSDCEIVDEQPAVKTEKGKPKFNPKTVFLNKELSIKIAKKNPQPPPSVIDNKSKEKLNAKGRHTVWISDSVMVKKVKPTQSFLAQDSRNKKPPDSHVTEKMVSDFFENYYRQQVLSICALFTSREWLGTSRSYVCSYFFVKSDKFCNTDTSHARDDFFLNNSENTTVPETSNNGSSVTNSPETLFSLCTQTLQKHLSLLGSVFKENVHPMSDEITYLKERTPEPLFRLCLKSLIATDSVNENYTNDENELFQVAIEESSSICVNKDSSATINNDEAFDEPYICVNEYFSITNDENNETFEVLSLQSMCHKRIINLICEDNSMKKDQFDPIMDLIWETDPSQKEDAVYTNVDKIGESNTNVEDKMYPVISGNEQIHKLSTSRIEDISCYDFNENDLDLDISFKKGNKNGIKSLFSLCVKFIQRQQKSCLPRSEENDQIYYSTSSLKQIALENIKYYLNRVKLHDFDNLGNQKSFLPRSKPNITIHSSPNLCMEDECYPITSVNEQIPKKWLRSRNDNLSFNGFDENNLDHHLDISTKQGHKNGIKSLFSLCIKSIQRQQKSFLPRSEENDQIYYSSNSLKQIALENINYYLNLVKLHNFDDNLGNITSVERLVTHRVKQLASICFENITPYFVNDDIDQANKHNLDEFTINSVNTLSEEAFHNMQMTCQEEQENTQYLEVEEAPYDNDNDFAGDFEEYEEENHLNEGLPEENNIEENSWVSQVRMKELKSCFIPSAAKNVGRKNIINEENERLQRPVLAQIKIEPEIEEAVDPSIVKTEPVCDLDEMVSIPENIITKREIIEEADNPKVPIQRHNSSSYNVDTFETFVRSNKMMYEIEETPNTADEIFSQSALRVRRQYEPDPDGENYEDDSSMNLLIPHTFEPLNIETAKDSLMESSSDDEGSSKKVTGKKKSDKKGRGRPKKSDTKQNNKDATPSAKDKEKPAPPAENELVVLTRRMREKIRQEEKKIESSDSETEKSPLASRKEKDRKDNSGKLKPEDLPLQLRKEMDRKENDKSKLSKSNKKVENEIQCNSVDSTQQTDANVNDTRANTENDQQFTGFSAVDQNEMYSYQKYVKYVYDQILPKVISEENDVKQPHQQVHDPALIIPDDHNRSNSPLINPDEPIEMLECEPTMPSFEDFEPEETKKITKDNKPRPKSKKTKVKHDDSEAPEVTKATKPVFTERDGWQCYPIDVHETKLYQKAEICLEKLPESFVETYFKYQNISDKNTEDAEVDRLTNLNSLNRSSNLKEVKTRPKAKDKSDELTEQSNVSRPSSPAHSDHYNELEPSEDEGANVDDEVPPPVPLKSSENCLAKNSLMNDDDSETELLKIKQELDDSSELKERPKKIKGPKTGPVLPKSEHPELLMLTADKSLNKELNLLHAPVLKDEIPETSKGPATRNKNKIVTKSHSPRDKAAPEDDSSSEEEKQWVSTKEKLLKRMGKNKDTTRLDDAKRAKLVSEFIERRADMPDTRKRGRGRRPRKISRKILEREKQLRVLSHELFGDALTDATHAGKASSQSFFKGRRNIRKVIDKKSLARSTVVANMEEFERKCRLNQRQTRLRELLGCEEGVNVLVINDEVCLEYDFENHQPVVTVHPFFTKVMKAHQYEGVKFMWDACFESLEKVESGHSGGGCILAHCMGLGKTLQVLALLHTVLTHPRVGMQRVLVCCPLSTVLNWVDEIHKWIGPVTDQIKVFELSKLRKTYERAYQLEDWYSGGGIFIIGYELFRSLSTLDPELDDIRPTIINKIRTALLDPGPDIIVCDEGHLLKNDCSVLSVAMSRVMTKRRIVLTGTPMQNNLREYYCMVNFIKPNLLGTYSEYSNRFENPIMNGQHRDSIEEDIKLMKQRTHILHKVLEGCLQRQEASVLYPYLPKKHEYTVFISLTKCQWDLYRHYISNYTKKSKQSILRDFHILQKIWSHPQVLHRFQMRTRDADGHKIKPEKLEDDLANEDLTATEDMKPADTEVWWLEYLEGGNMLDSLESSHKFAVVFRILDECIALGDKVLIFSTSLITMDSLEYFLRKINKWSLGQEYFRLDGSVPPEVRQKWCREFNAEHNEKTKLFLISTRAGSLGLNMVAANRVIILDTSWNPAHDIQSIFRVYRFGQKKDCYIYRLVAMGTMEQKIYERSVTKQAVSCRVVDEQQIDRHYNMAELTELYRFDDEGVSVAGGLAVGVTDVALLRVARHAGLHAVHEHDSLLRGSSEQCLPEHERAAAWMQFQQEHAHKQMQNQLTSSFSLHIPLKTLEQVPAPGLIQLPAIKSENWLQNYEEPPEKQPNKQKKGKRSKSLKEQPDELPPTQEALDIENGMVKKIMDILVKHKFQTEGPNEIAALVSNVRKIVAYGRVPEGSFNKELTESIANVLLGKDPPMPALTDVLPIERKRGRPRKIKQVEQYTPIETPKEEIIDTGGRRRAAIAAERQLSTIKDSVIEIDCDDDWQADSDYAPDEIEPDLAPDIIEPEASTSKSPEPTVKKEKDTQQQTKKQLDTEISSILLSDDDEPTPPPKQKTSKKTVKAKKDDSEAVPLHPSLLSNKNFVKIVAHTYLEGNPMLDEDAAMLAAQYSTQKALKEFESLGKPIFSGPIYDIAIQVLGKEILQKLHKTNPVLKKTETATPEKANVKTEQSTPSEQKAPRVKAKGLAELTGKQMPALGYAKPVAGTPESLQSPSVVPVGLFKAAGNMSMTTEEPLPSLPSTSQTKEESILPDDDDVIIGDSAVASVRRNSQPLILNSVSSKLTGKTPKLKPMTIKISSGQIIRPTITMSTPQTMTMIAPQTMATSAPQIITLQSGVPTLTTPAPAPSQHQDTICLDSDDEETITPNIPPTPPPPIKRIALKSTAKIVPISLADANSHLNSLPMQSPVFNTQVINSSQLPNKKGYVVIPASSLTRLQPGATIPENSKCQKLHRLAQPPPNVSQLKQQSMTQVVTSVPQNTINAPYPMTLTSNPNFITSEQNVMIDTLPQNPYPIRSTITGPRYTILPNNVQPRIPQSIPQTMNSHHMNYINTMAQPINLNEINSIPEQSTPIKTTPINTNVTNTATESILPNRITSKTVCKPGDILHITKTGEVKILNRGVEDATNTSIPSIVPDQAPVNTVTVDDDTPNNTMQYTGTSDTTVTLDDDPPTKTSKQYKGKPPATPMRDDRPMTRQHRGMKPSSPKRSRIISSSSSSDSSRSSSPKDPLDILKDVVHIKAADEFDKLAAVKTDSRPKSNTQTHSKDSSNKSTIGNTTITKSYAATTPSPTPKSTPSKTSHPVKPSRSQSDKLMDQINKTDTILKKLNSFLGPSDKQKTLQTRKSTARSNSPVIESVDLTEPSISTSKSSSSLKSSASTSKPSSSTSKSLSSTSKTSSSTSKSSSSTSKSSSSSSKPSSSTSSSNRKVLSLLSKDIQVAKTESKAKSSSSWHTEKKEAKTITGTSKNIIISGSGKASSLAPADGAKKNIRVTSVERIAPAAPVHKPWSDSKKRPAASTETNAPKKKKTEPMTLKDFDIDDIDDIIELE